MTAIGGSGSQSSSEFLAQMSQRVQEQAMREAQASEVPQPVVPQPVFYSVEETRDTLGEGTTATQATQAPTQQRFPRGTRVKLISARYRWGDHATVGDTGIVAHWVSPDEVYVILDRWHGVGPYGSQGWQGCEADLELLVETAATPSSAVKHIAGRIQQIHYGTARILEHKRSEASSEYSAAMETARKVYKKLINYTKLQKMARSMQGVSPAELEGSIEVLFTLYESIEVSDYGDVVAVTKPITVNFNGDTFKLGQFIVKLHIGESTSITNADAAVSCNSGGYAHPHVTMSGHCCWGSWANTVTKLEAEADWLELLRLIHEFLSHVNAEGWYRNVYYWSPDLADRCHNCWKLLGKGCECVEYDNDTNSCNGWREGGELSGREE